MGLREKSLHWLILQSSLLRLSRSQMIYSSTSSYMMPQEHPLLSWDDANAYCQEKGGELASIHNQEQQDEAVTLCQNVMGPIGSGGSGCFIGLNDISNERLSNRDGWIYIDGTPYDYQAWDQAKPNQYLNREEDCVLLWLNSGLWNDMLCNNSGDTYWDYVSFICNVATSPQTQAPTDHPYTFTFPQTTEHSTITSPDPSDTAITEITDTSVPVVDPSINPTTSLAEVTAHTLYIQLGLSLPQTTEVVTGKQTTGTNDISTSPSLLAVYIIVIVIAIFCVNICICIGYSRISERRLSQKHVINARKETETAYNEDVHSVEQGYVDNSNQTQRGYTEQAMCTIEAMKHDKIALGVISTRKGHNEMGTSIDRVGIEALTVRDAMVHDKIVLGVIATKQ